MSGAGVIACADQVMHGLFQYGGLFKVISQQRRVFIEARGIEPFQRFTHALMQLPPIIFEQ